MYISSYINLYLQTILTCHCSLNNCQLYIKTIHLSHTQTRFINNINLNSDIYVQTIRKSVCSSKNCHLNIEIIHYSHTQIRHIKNIKLKLIYHSQSHSQTHKKMYYKKFELLSTTNYPRNIITTLYHLVHFYTIKYHYIHTNIAQIIRKNNQHTMSLFVKYRTRFFVVCSCIFQIVRNIYKLLSTHKLLETIIILLIKIR